MTDERRLGSDDLTTPPLMLGGNVFGWTVDAAGATSILDAFVAGGGRAIDTADVYAAWVPGNTGGESETIIGAWLSARGRRDDVLIATKVGAEMNGTRGLAADRIEAVVEASLRRLRTDYIDVYFAHFDDPETPLDVTLEAFNRLVRAGKVRTIGASNYDASRLGQALNISAHHGWAPYRVLQPAFNLVDRAAFEGALQDLCVANNIAVVPYYSLASGFLTGKYRDREDLAGKARGHAAGRHLNRHGLGVLHALDVVAEEAHATLAQVALAWLAAQPGVAAPIASATSVEQVEELLGAMQLRLTGDQLGTLDAASMAAVSDNA